MSVSLNITSIVLYTAGAIVITGSNIWLLISDFLPEYKVAFASSNIAAIFSIGVGAIFTQADLCKKNRELRTLRVNNLENQV